jgi:aminopeptidase N
MPSLTRSEASERAALLTVTAMEVDLDLTGGDRPDVEEFGSTTTIRFTCHQPGAGTFLDVAPASLRSLSLNGAGVDPAALRDGRVELTDLAAENEVVAVATMRYSRDGQGLHRAVDPADGEHYVYGHLFLDAAPSVFACFDQPDLKAPYAVSVTAPEGWRVVGNGAATEVSPGRWELARTQPLATYFVTVCAGPWASVLAEHDGIPLGIHARASLREPLERQAEQMLEVTRASFDYYHQLFGIRYPFGEYHQVFVPEFNAGAMENPGCVTFRDTYVFRGAAARDEVLTRSNTIAHEMAHMWFGDLVTMRWWDDLWLNESFAEYMAHRTTVDATEFTEGWVDSTVARKMWGYAAERTPSTHPVAGGAALDAQAALQDFDGISYAKGAATLRQLIAHIGDDAFIAGVSAYLAEHAYGNGTLADFLGFMERASGADLGEWSKAWLLTAGLDVIAADLATGVVTREAPEAFPADRPHTLDVAGFTGGEEVWRVSATLTGPETDVPALREAPPAELVVPNASDLTWATVALDPATLAAAPRGLADVPDAQARAVVWAALVDGVCLGTVDPRLVVETFGHAWPREDNDSVLNRVAGVVLGRLVPSFLPPAEQAGARGVVAAAAEELLEGSEPGSTRALLGARLLARSSADEARLRPWAEQSTLPAGLEGDSDFRWLVVRNMAGQGMVDRGFVEQVRHDDDTLSGRLGELAARAALPGEDAKAWAWEQLTVNRDRSNYELNALAAGFWSGDDLSTLRGYVPRYFADVPAMARWVGADALGRVATLAYPSRVVEQSTAEASAATLAGDGLTPAVRRSVVDADSELREALRSRALFG